MKNGEAYIARSKNRLKSYGESVYLNNEDTFEIELFNPNTKTIMAAISINGESIYGSNGGIVIEPGQRCFLERSINKNAKFVFRTYQVEGSKEVNEAIVDNGNVTITFYSQKDKVIPVQSYVVQPYWVNNDYLSYPHFNSNQYFYYGGIPPNQYFQCDNTIGPATVMTTNGLSGTSGASAKSLFETGRVGEGDASDQRFSSTTIEFEHIPINKVEMKILPNSTKLISIKEIRKYCHACGVRIRKQSWKYCPSCGEILN